MKKIIILLFVGLSITACMSDADKNAQQLVAAGTDVLVAGSYVFSAQDPIATIAHLKQLTK